MFRYFADFTLGVYPMNRGAVLEIDSMNELIKIDASYKGLGEK